MSEKLTCPICGEPTRIYIKNIDAVLDRKLNKAFIQEGKINFDN